MAKFHSLLYGPDGEMRRYILDPETKTAVIAGDFNWLKFPYKSSVAFVTWNGNPLWALAYALPALASRKEGTE